MPTRYSDGLVTLTHEAIIIHHYYFPTAQSRVIPWSKVRGVSVHELTFWNGKYRIWGMGIRPAWFHLDTDRPRKSRSIEIDTGGMIKAAITPAELDKALAIIRDETHL